MIKMMNARDIADELGISVSHAYKIIRNLNKDLEAGGYITVCGKIPKAFWNTRFFGSEAGKEQK